MTTHGIMVYGFAVLDERLDAALAWARRWEEDGDSVDFVVVRTPRGKLAFGLPIEDGASPGDALAAEDGAYGQALCEAHATLTRGHSDTATFGIWHGAEVAPR